MDFSNPEDVALEINTIGISIGTDMELSNRHDPPFISYS